MTKAVTAPRAAGQLIWCPQDPSLGIGVVTRLEPSRINVRFLRLQQERAYTTRSSEAVIARYRIGAGERVRSSDGEQLRVVGLVDAEGDLAIYELEDGRQVPESDLIPEVRDIGPKARLESLSLVHPEVVRARMQGLTLAASWRHPGLAAILGARALWLPHQIDVASRAIMNDRVRMLLADEVGLGKTVEAALIYAGLRYEGRAERVLILPPQTLAIQWLGEIFRKTHELLVLLDKDRLDDARQDFPDLSPFEAHQRIIASIDRIAGDPQLAAEACAATWDLVIVDEAHHLRWDAHGGGNAKYRLIEALAGRTDHLLLLTATPMALDPAEYHALLRLLDPARFDDPKSFASIRERVKVIRDAAREIEAAVADGVALGRGTKKAAAALVEDDASDAAAFAAFTKLGPKAAGRAEAAATVIDALRDRHGLADFVVRNRRGPVGGMPRRLPEVFVLEPTELQADLIEVGESVMFDLAETIDDLTERHRTLGRSLRALWAAPRALIDILRPLSPTLAEQLAPPIAKVVAAPIDADGLPTGDARLRWLVRMLRRDRDDKVLVFVETDIAVRALRDAIDAVLGGDIAVFHGGLAPRDQDRQVAWFRDAEGPQVMLSTEAGGEGRNFQFCNRVVLYDMPWRPATVEQRIGRIDRVGQNRDVHILVPCFKSGYEAAILKVMQEAIGVLDETVGGIDHALEYVSDRLGALVLGGGGADDWKQLYLETRTLVRETRERIDAAVDPILDHASFSPARVEALLARVPRDLEARTESFVSGYADNEKLDIHVRAGDVVDIEGAAGAAGGSGVDATYAATFSRTYGLDHEGVDFLSFGHPLVEQALEWAREAGEASAALAICRGFPQDGAVFLWRFGVDLPDDVPQAAAFFTTQLHTFALDESGGRVAELEDLFDSGRPLDRMDAKPLRGAADRWSRLVDQNYADAEVLADEAVGAAVEAARARLRESTAVRLRHLERQLNRSLVNPRGRNKRDLRAESAAKRDAVKAEAERVRVAIENARPRLLAAVAVRLVKTKVVSG